METFSALLAICAGIQRSPVNSPHKGQWHGALMFYLICVWINSWVNDREAGDLGRYRPHYDVTVMTLRALGQSYDYPVLTNPMNIDKLSDNIHQQLWYDHLKTNITKPCIYLIWENVYYPVLFPFQLAILGKIVFSSQWESFSGKTVCVLKQNPEGIETNVTTSLLHNKMTPWPRVLILFLITDDCIFDTEMAYAANHSWWKTRTNSCGITNDTIATAGLAMLAASAWAAKLFTRITVLNFWPFCTVIR